MELFRLFFSFQGRIGRLSYWLGTAVTLVYWLLAYEMVLALLPAHHAIATSVGGVITTPPPARINSSVLALVAMSLAFCTLIFAWAGIAVGVKRWHDRGKSGLWALLGFVPLVGTVWTFVECGCLAGTPGENRFDPKPEADPGKPSAQPYQARL